MRAMSRHIDAEKIEFFAYSPWRAIATKSSIDNIPTADVAEVKHGYWNVLAHGITLLNSDDLSLPLSYHLLQCSECKYVAIGAQIDKYEWCPYCGAKMDGGSK